MSGGAVVLLVAALAALVPAAVAAQGATIVRDRARAGAAALLTIGDAHLYVPAGAVPAGSTIAFGLDGIPDATGRLGGTGVLVTAAGGLLGPVAVVLPAGAADLVAGAPALLEPGSGRRAACLVAGERIACPVDRPGAFVLASGEGAATDTALLTEALRAAAAPPPAASGPGDGPPVGAAVVLAAGMLVALVAAWRARQRQPPP